MTCLGSIIVATINTSIIVRPGTMGIIRMSTVYDDNEFFANLK